LGIKHDTELANQYIMSSVINCIFVLRYTLEVEIGTIRFLHNFNQCIDVRVYENNQTIFNQRYYKLIPAQYLPDLLLNMSVT